MGLALAAPAQTQWDQLVTVAERSEFRATATSDQVLEFCRQLDQLSPLVKLAEIGKTFEGRSIPLLIIADPPVASAEEARRDDRLVVYAQGNIHSGEVCGKEASLILARELASTPDHPLLEDLIVLLAPNLSADSNDRMNPNNRRGQVGPEEGMGTRPNAQGLNINRDWTKLDTPAGRAAVQCLVQWEPVIFIDLHTTNGSRHGYTLTYDGQRHPACDDELRKLTRYQLLPAVTEKMEANTGYKTFFYGNFGQGNTTWTIDPALPRYSTHYGGLRHIISILSEAYSYASYKDRIFGTLEFTRHCFQYVADNKETVRRVVDEAKQRTIELGNNPGPENLVHLRREMKLKDEPVTVLGFEGRGGPPREYQVLYNDLSIPTLSVRRPYAYLVPARFTHALENLKNHGIEVQALEADREFDVEVYRIDGFQKAARSYEGHNLATVEVTPRRTKMRFEAGTVLVRTGQPLGTLAAYLLEPQSEDGLCTWNFFDDGLTEGGDFPVVRIPEPFQTPKSVAK